uniref:SET domain-containing protein n=1 Tax=Attheya septentrionalis TaxID=420275 RepID=A0A7S2U733_9STRA|mmetsp:Transcript_1331/g.2382  ORF Transcript_1331/g.2382 Transcript_1331/m.2382 type:complete len:251 (+) Transcript_1331:143-895(+)
MGIDLATKPKSLEKIGVLKIQPQGPIGRVGKKDGGVLQVQCWAHTRGGVRCKAQVAPRDDGEPIPIPYCDRHLHSGDGAVKVVSHPFAGKCLVARFDLPSKYRIAFWGKRGPCRSCDNEDRSISFYPPNKVTGKNVDDDGNVKTNNYNGILDPSGTGDLIQYAACPGPTERQNMKSTFRYWGIRNGSIGGLEFVTLEPIPANTQLCHWYGPGWWSARGIKRRDVGTGKYPAPKRQEQKIRRKIEDKEKDP